MSDLVTKAKEEIRIFERPSKKTAEEMIEEIERLKSVLLRVGNSPYPISEYCTDADRALLADLVVAHRAEQEKD